MIQPLSTIVHNGTVKSVDYFQYLRIVKRYLILYQNVEKIVEKGQQRLHFLRKLTQVRSLINIDKLPWHFATDPVRVFRVFSVLNHILVGNLSVLDKDKLH